MTGICSTAGLYQREKNAFQLHLISSFFLDCVPALPVPSIPVAEQDALGRWLFFYGFWDVRFLFLIAFSTTGDFTIGRLLQQKHLSLNQRKTVVLFLIGSALLFLCPNWSALRWEAGVEGLHDFFNLQPLGLEVLGGTIVNAGVNLQRLAGVKVQHGRKQWGPRYRGPHCFSHFIPLGWRLTAVLALHGATGVWSGQA